MKKINLPEEISGFPKELGRELPFRLPEHYFEEFQVRLNTRMEAEKLSHSGKRVTLFRYLKPVFGLAAAFAAVFLLVYVPVRLMNHPEEFASASEVNEEESILNMVENVDDHTFFSLLTGNNGASGEESQDLEVYIASNYSDYDIYLETQK